MWVCMWLRMFAPIYLCLRLPQTLEYKWVSYHAHFIVVIAVLAIYGAISLCLPRLYLLIIYVLVFKLPKLLLYFTNILRFCESICGCHIIVWHAKVMLIFGSSVIYPNTTALRWLWALNDCRHHFWLSPFKQRAVRMCVCVCVVLYKPTRT